MDLLLQKQRLQQIVDSYSLAEGDLETFSAELYSLIEDFPWFLVELALVEVLVQNWLRYPMPRGLLFLEQVRERLREWQQASAVSSFLTPNQFEHVTGLVPQGFEELEALSKHSHKVKSHPLIRLPQPN